MRSEPPTGDELTRLLVSMKGNVLAEVAQEAASAKRTLTDRVIAALLGVVLLLGLGAGAAFALGIVPPLGTPSGTAPVPSATPIATPAPTPTPSPDEFTVIPAAPETWAQPASRYGLDCATMVDESLVSALFTTAVAPADPIVTASGVGIAIPRRTSILSEGGTVCEWSNGAPYNDQYGSNPDYVGLTVSVLPRPAEGWSERTIGNGMPFDTSGCGNAGCTGSSTAGDAWIVIEAFGGASHAVDEAGWESLLDAIIAAVSAAAPPGELIVPERTNPFPLECDAIIPLDAVRSITATPDAEAWGAGGGGWSDWAEARAHADNVGCQWGLPDSDSLVASVSFIREGAWAYERMLHAGTAVPVELAELRADDAASIRCDANFGSSCAVDLRVGPDWFNVSANDEATAIALAEAALAQLAP